MTPAPAPPGEAPHIPRPSDWRLTTWRSFLCAHSRVLAQLESELADDADLPLAWYDVLLQLAEAPRRRLRMAELADRVLLSRSGLTRLVDRLEGDALVRRVPSQQDKRGTYTVLTPAGLDRLRRAAPIHLAGVQRHFLAQYSDEELRELGALLERLTAPPQ